MYEALVGYVYKFASWEEIRSFLENGCWADNPAQIDIFKTGTVIAGAGFSQ